MCKLRQVLYSIFFLTSILFSQNNYYWSAGRKIQVSEDKSTLIAVYKDEFKSKNMASIYNKKEKVANFLVSEDQKISRVTFKNNQVKSKKDAIENADILETDLEWYSFGYKLENGSPVHPTHQISFLLKKGYNIDAIEPFLKNRATFSRTNFGTLMLKVINSDIDIFSLANEIYESGIVEYCHPDFIANIIPTDDPLYSEQYYLHNTGQFAGQYNMDIGLPEAWDITKGSNQIIVAVFDQGVEDHEDLNDLYGNTRVLAGYTPLTNGNGTPLHAGDAHGEACAGIIAASHNELDIKGIAPNVKILPINILALGTTDQQVADGINWAWQHGADILSNSWGKAPGNYVDSYVNALNNAMTLGRNGKGCVVVFSAGNNGESGIDFPNGTPGVICVSALNRWGNLSSYSSRGDRIDLCAFGGEDKDGKDIRTLDRMGNPGYNTGNTISNFNGTSAACPQVSGVAALILSLNPNLTSQQVTSLLKSQSVDMGIVGHDNDFGDGRVYATKAVAKTFADMNPQYKYVVGNVSSPTLVERDARMIFWESPAPGQAAGVYICDGYYVDVTINESFNEIPKAWWIGGIGYTYSNPNDASPYLAQSVSTNQIHFRTYVFYLKKNGLGQDLNFWTPFDPTKAGSLEYAYLGIPAPPPAPALASPANNATNVVTAPTLSWSAPTGATGYHVQIGTNSTFSIGTIMLEDETLTTPSRQVGLVPSTTYYWRVRAKNATGWGAWSATNSLTSSATLANNTVWEGLVRLTQTVTVAAGNTLTVLPGTVLKINGEISLSVSGTLIAEGTSASRITIDGEDPSRTYLAPMINPIDNGSLSLKYADLMNKTTQVVFFATGNLTVDHCTFTEFDKIVPYSTVYGLAIEIYPGTGSNIGSVTITNNTITCRVGSVDGTPWGGGWGIWIAYVNPTSTTISNNTISNCYTGFYTLYSGTATLTGNTFANNNYGLAGVGTGTVSNCNFTGNGVGSRLTLDAGGSITNSTFSGGGSTGIVCTAGAVMTLQGNTFSPGLATAVFIYGINEPQPTTVRMYSNTITSANTGIVVDWMGVAYIGDNLGGGTGGNIITGCNTGIRIGSGSGTVQIRHNQILATNYDQVGIELHAGTTLEYNTIRGGLASRSDCGVHLYPPGSGFQHNTFSHWTYAVFYDDGISGWQGFSLNNFESNYYAIYNSYDNSTSIMGIMAENNWWGTTNELYVRGMFYGNRDVISYSPIHTPRYTDAGPYGQSPPATSIIPDQDGEIAKLLRDSGGKAQLPQEFGLSQNYPNPFNPSTVISYQLPKEGHVSLKIYNVLGKELRVLVDGTRGAGFHSITWDGKDHNGNIVGSGIYFYRLVSSDMENGGKEGFSTIKKMLLVR